MYDTDDRRILALGSIFEQSCQFKSNPAYLVHEHMRAMLLPLIYINPRHVTVLGLGGGCLVSCLFKHFCNLRLHAVELRKAVIDIAFEYFQLPVDQRLSVIKSDAWSYISSGETEETDILFCDMYHSDGIERLQLHPKFIRQCRRLLNTQGWLVLNYFQSHWVHKSAFDTILSIFEKVYVCSLTTGNRIVLATDTMPLLSHDMVAQRVDELEGLLGFSMMPYFMRMERFDLKVN
ncbi:hypothetical protein ONV78_30520 [Hahella sp. CR1]|uniref:spermidine synthase n=1 Tax=Hahella sp. CR1 TaxID=2992807 RepID=UPI0024432B3D|nr:hypothetical protein [Hahella sp. CR1]MDG9672107.1 hypothetical protein [Hahella sp. CR1]